MLLQAARELEFLVHSLSTTADGYKARLRTTAAAVKQLAVIDTWSSSEVEEFEEAQDVIRTLKDLCRDEKRRGVA